jgi:basic amino acid/polyamine antiporter, APA family
MAPERNLVRDLGRWDLVAVVVNAIVGAGIFGLPARVFALAGTYSLIAYLTCIVPIALIALCFAEVSSRFKETGGMYLYAREAFGSFVGFEMGWLAWLVRLTAFAALCNLFADYFAYFVPGAAAGPGRAVTIVLVVTSLTVLNLVGVRVASHVINIFTIGKLVPLVLLVGIGVFMVDLRAYSFGVWPSYGNFSSAVLILMFAFTGFEIAPIPAGEAVDPRRHMPFALLVGIAMTALLYVLVQAVCIGIVTDLGMSERPLADAGLRIFGTIGASIVSLGALISVIGTMNGIVLAGPRLVFAMAEHGQFPRIFATTHPRFRTPHIAILVSSAFMLALTLSGTFITAATISTLIRLLTYAVTCAALPVLRQERKGRPAIFRVPAGPLVSMVALAMVAWLFSNSTWNEAQLVAAAAAIGLPFYFLRNVRSDVPASTTS